MHEFFDFGKKPLPCRITEISTTDALYGERDRFIGQPARADHLSIFNDGWFAGCLSFEDGNSYHFFEIHLEFFDTPHTFFEDCRQVALAYIRALTRVVDTYRSEGWTGMVSFTQDADEDSWMEGVYDSDGDGPADPAKTFDRGAEILLEERNRLASTYGWTAAKVEYGYKQLLEMVRTNQDLHEFGITADEVLELCR